MDEVFHLRNRGLFRTRPWIVSRGYARYHLATLRSPRLQFHLGPFPSHRNPDLADVLGNFLLESQVLRGAV